MRKPFDLSIVIPIDDPSHISKLAGCILVADLAIQCILVADDGVDGEAAAAAVRKAAETSASQSEVVLRRGHAHEVLSIAGEEAYGEFVAVCEPGGSLDAKALTACLAHARRTGADLLLFDWKAGRSRCRPTDLLLDKAAAGTTDWLDLGIQCLCVTAAVAWNRLVRTDLLRSCLSRFSRPASRMELHAFLALQIAEARSIAYKPAVVYASPGMQQGPWVSGLDTGEAADLVASLLGEYPKASFAESLLCHATHYAAHVARDAIRQAQGAYASQDFADAYRKMSEAFRATPFMEPLVYNFDSPADFCMYRIMREVPYEDFLARMSVERVVSFTSYPGRIGTVAQVVASLLEQTMPADRILLYLADSQFPGRLEDLPEDLVEHHRAGHVEIRWCEDIRSHKKYAFAMRDFPEAQIMLFDDDIHVRPTSLELLTYGCCLFPHAVSALNGRILAFNEEGTLDTEYVWNTFHNGMLLQPSMQILGFSGHGTAYPPGALTSWFEDLDEIRGYFKLSETSDEPILKSLALAEGLPYVALEAPRERDAIKGTQRSALKLANRHRRTATFTRVFAAFTAKTGIDLMARARDGIPGTRRIGGITVSRLAFKKALSLFQKAKATSDSLRLALEQQKQRADELEARISEYDRRFALLEAKLEATQSKRSPMATAASLLAAGRRAAKNHLPYPYPSGTKTDEGITWTDLGDGRIHADGTATENSRFTLTLPLGRTRFATEEERYVVTLGTKGASPSTYYLSGTVGNKGEKSVLLRKLTPSKLDAFSDAFILDTAGYTHFGKLYIVVKKGAILDHVVFAPMICPVGLYDGHWEAYAAQ